MTRFAIAFPGQGSQSVGMLAELAEQHAVIKETFAEASQVLGYDLFALVMAGPAEDLNKTWRTQPALLTASVALWRLWQQQGGVTPAVMAGHSLGEYSALVCSGALAFADAVKLVELRGLAMQEAVPMGDGAMAAILGLDDETIASACAEVTSAAGAGEVVEAVNFNGPGQTVIAGTTAAVESACAACKARGAKRALLLPVSAPFHSSLMRPAAEKLAARLAEMTFADAQMAVIHNVDAVIASGGKGIKDALVRQAASPVRWVETIRRMAAMGIGTVVECGPGKVLAGLSKRCAESVGSLALADLAAIESAVGQLE